ncbi:hypothetical protein BDW59DRAFT_178210 [Aspergillus cavernicola]|uniref:Homeodomain-like protein n=1 Tax=Aspergillus cavernicola TaxID=176166 RepID=A0ABR4HEB3_9EURO
MGDLSSRRRWWTQEEDRILQEEVKYQVELGGQQGTKNWSAIAERLPGRSNKDCRKRWTKISLSSRRGTWSGPEDHLLRKAVSKFGFQWTKVAGMVGSRHPDQCAKRWHHSLDPNVKRSPWTPDEDSALLDAVQRVGRDWKEIGRELFPSRSTTDIKNRYSPYSFSQLAPVLMTDNCRYVILSRRRGLSVSISSDSNLSSLDVGISSEPGQLMDCKSLNQLDMFTPTVDLTMTTAPHLSDGLNLTLDTLAMSLPPEILDTDLVLDWAAFDGQQISPFSMFFPETPNNSEIESCNPSLLTNRSNPETPSMSECSGIGPPSTLVLEGLQPETVNLVIDTLLKNNSKFEMRLYNTGS